MKQIHFLYIAFFFLCGPLWASENAVSDYALAQKCYHSLDQTSTKGWKRCLHAFEKIIQKYPKSVYAKKALFTIGKIEVQIDPQKSLQSYNQFLRDYPQDSMADDALFEIAKLRFEKENDREKALRALNALLERYPEGDMVDPAKRYLEQIKRKTSGQKSEFEVRTIVIDPGHGGEDSGAKGLLGTKEAEVALQVSRKLASLLKKQSGFKVLLTRTNHRGLSLKERTQLANRKQADLFISIHANAHSSRQVKGVQTFYLNNATSAAAQELARRENRVAGKTLSLPERILTTMLQTADTLESKDLAHAVQESLVARLKGDYSGVEDLKVETAIFQVLDGVRCPSILIETSFITHPAEEKRLRDSQYQWALAEGIGRGIKKYIGVREKAVASTL